MPQIADPTAEKTEQVRRSDRVVEHLREHVQSLGLKAGERLPAERDLAQQLGVTRGDVRRALGYLAALGVLEVRHGVGAFLARHPAGLGTAPLELLRAIGGFETWQMFEARRTLETELASLAAERGGSEHLAAMADEIDGMAATLEDAETFLVHDIRFHRAVAQAAGNPILEALMEVIASALYKERRQLAGTRERREEALNLHQAIYSAIGSHDRAAAQTRMREHLHTAEFQKAHSTTNGAALRGHYSEQQNGSRPIRAKQPSSAADQRPPRQKAERSSARSTQPAD